MRSIPLQQFKKGYRKHAAALGYKQMSARPWQLSDVRTVLQQILQKLGKAAGVCAAMLARDGFIIAVLWQTSSRGCNAGAWRLENLRLPTGDQIFKEHCKFERSKAVANPNMKHEA